MSQQQIGPREQALANQRAEQFNDIPDFLDRTKGMTDEQIRALSARARKNAGRPRKAAFLSAPERDPGLTEVDRANIKALKKAGADKVSAVRQVGAKLKSETERKGKPMITKITNPPLRTHEPPAAQQEAKAIAPAPKPKETDVSKKTKTTKAKSKKASQAKARTPVKGKTETGVRPGSKLETIVGLLKRAEGCTTKEVLAATGWPAVSMPQQAKAAGLTLKKEKDGSVTRYRAA